MPRKICFLTGKRGGFGALIPTFREVQNNPQLELSLIATDMHLSERFGNTINEVDKWVENVERVPLNQEDDSAVSRVVALANAMSGIAQKLEKIQPDIFVVLGDRGEVYSAVLAALHLGIPVAHIQGGDVSGNVDELMRHAITKMSHIHFPSTKTSANRIINMGEEDWRVHVVGDTHIDILCMGEHTPGQEARKKYKIGENEKYALVLIHPETLRPTTSYDNMNAVLSALSRKKLRSIVIYPCSDHGYQGIITAIKEVEGDPIFSIHKNIEAPDFWGLQEEASVFIGNSSAGIIEAPYFNLPVINIGLRQVGRERENNIIDVPVVSEEKILESLDLAFSSAFNGSINKDNSHIYGDGKASIRIVDVLKDIKLDQGLFEKRITY